MNFLFIYSFHFNKKVFKCHFNCITSTLRVIFSILTKTIYNANVKFRKQGM